ncbi:MAG: SLBB domain-containing protein, partial [Actinomycetota bacterium]
MAGCPVPRVEPPAPPQPPPVKTGRIVVSVAGAVREPGIFEVDEDTRVGEVIE